MSSLKARQTEALPPVGIGPVSPDFYVQDSSAAGAKDQEKKSLDARVANLEKAAKKSSDTEKKKKAADAEKPLVKVGGKIHADMGWFSQDANNIATVGDIQDGVDFRRARIAVSGTILDVTNYKIEMDFAASGRPSFRDVYVGVSDLPYVNNVRVGHYKEWFGLEQLTSDDYITFIERSLPDAFAPARTGDFRPSTTSKGNVARGRSGPFARTPMSWATTSATRANGRPPAASPPCHGTTSRPREDTSCT